MNNSSSSKLVNIVTPLHKATSRNYLQRMQDEKAHCMKIARNYDRDFWDGDRRYGYGGYKYDGRWSKVAEKFIEKYRLKDGDRILDIGCGKGFLLYEIKKLLPNTAICGFDISSYAIEHAKEEVRDSLFAHDAADTPWPFADNEFDFAFSLATLHNLKINQLKAALVEFNRISKQQYLMVESFRNETEQFNLQCWALTCFSFYTPEEWIWLYNEFGYQGDYEFIYFE